MSAIFIIAAIICAAAIAVSLLKRVCFWLWLRFLDLLMEYYDQKG